jgi:hypothetical protein
MARQDFIAEADQLIEARIRELRGLTFEQARSLPEVAGADQIVGGFKATVTTFRQESPYELTGMTLVTVLVARPRWFGVTAHHIERGLVFSPEGPVREATVEELENSGG